MSNKKIPLSRLKKIAWTLDGIDDNENKTDDGLELLNAVNDSMEKSIANIQAVFEQKKADWNKFGNAIKTSLNSKYKNIADHSDVLSVQARFAELAKTFKAVQNKSTSLTSLHGSSSAEEKAQTSTQPTAPVEKEKAQTPTQPATPAEKEKAQTQPATPVEKEKAQTSTQPATTVAPEQVAPENTAQSEKEKSVPETQKVEKTKPLSKAEKKKIVDKYLARELTVENSTPDELYTILMSPKVIDDDSLNQGIKRLSEENYSKVADLALYYFTDKKISSYGESYARISAASILGKYKVKKAVPVLKAIFIKLNKLNKGHTNLRGAIAYALSEIDPSENTLKMILQALNAKEQKGYEHSTYRMRDKLYESLGNFSNPKLLDMLMKAIESKSWHIFSSIDAVLKLAKRGNSKALTALVKFLTTIDFNNDSIDDHIVQDTLKKIISNNIPLNSEVIELLKKIQASTPRRWIHRPIQELLKKADDIIEEPQPQQATKPRNILQRGIDKVKNFKKREARIAKIAYMHSLRSK